MQPGLGRVAARPSVASTLKVQLLCVDSTGAQLDIDARSMAVLEAARDSAELVDTPPTDLNPKTYSRRVKELLQQKEPQLLLRRTPKLPKLFTHRLKIM